MNMEQQQPQVRITWSPERDKIAAALVKFQAAARMVGRDKTAHVRSDKGNYSYNYADLATTIEATREARAAAELAVVQAPTGDERVGFTVTTTVLHSSGQWMEFDLSLRSGDTKPQTIGSLITYLRRYSYSAALGIATEEDDDGAAAQAATSSGRGPRSAAPRAPAAAPPPANDAQRAAGPSVTKEQVDEIVTCFKILEWGVPHQRSWVKKYAGVDTMKNLTAGQAADLIERLAVHLHEKKAEQTGTGAA